MTNSEQNDPLAQWMDGRLSDEEVKKLIPSTDFDRYQAILNQISNLEPDATVPQIDVSKIIASSNKNKNAKTIALNSTRFYLAIAASIAIVIGFFTLYQTSNTLEYSTGIGEVSNIILPDGKSKVYLAANSTVSLDESLWPLKRHLTLTGRAYFEVEKGTDFVVSMSGGNQVRVLGTRFEIHHASEFMNVICFEGKVETSNENNKLILTQNESITALKDTPWEKTRSTSVKPSWLQGSNQFTDAPLIQVINALESEFGLVIDYQGININQRFTGYFPIGNQDLAFQLVFEPFGIQYNLTENKLVLTSTQ